MPSKQSPQGAKLKSATTSQLLPAIVESVDDAIVGETLGGIITIWNSGAERLYGYSSQEAIGKSISMLTSSEQFPAYMALLSRLKQAGTLKNLKATHFKKDGKVISISLTLLPIKNHLGKIVGALSISKVNNPQSMSAKLHKATKLVAQLRRRNAQLSLSKEHLLHESEQRRLAEEQLKRSQDNFKQLIHNTLDIFTVMAADGTIIYESPSLRSVLGYHQHELIGKNAFSYVHPDDLPYIKTTFESVIARPGTTRSVEFRFRHKNGSWRMLESIGKSLLNNPAIQGVVVNSRDISERKQIEDQLRKSTIQLREAQQLAHMGSWEWDVPTNSITWSAELCKMYGIPPEKAPKTYKAYLRYVHPADISTVVSTVKKAMRLKEKFSFDYRLVRPDGTIRMLYGRGDVVVGEKGQVTKIFGTCQDITERKIIEQQLREASLEMERRVEERTLELSMVNQYLRKEVEERKRAEQQLMASLKEKEVLLNEIHHRVKNNLQIISSLLSLQFSRADNAQARGWLMESQNRIKVMALVHDKLYQSKNMSRIDFADYVRDLATQVFRSFGSYPENINLNIDVKPVFLDISAAIHCGLIVNELVSNALKHGFPEDQRGTICLTLKKSRGLCELIVSNDGIKPPEKLNIHSLPTLGFNLVLGLVEQLNGSIRMDVSKDTRFVIVFPYRGER